MIHHDELLALAQKYTPRGMTLFLSDGQLPRNSNSYEIRWRMRRDPENFFASVRVAVHEEIGSVEYFLRDNRSRVESSILDLLAEDAKR